MKYFDNHNSHYFWGDLEVVYTLDFDITLFAGRIVKHVSAWLKRLRSRDKRRSSVTSSYSLSGSPAAKAEEEAAPSSPVEEVGVSVRNLTKQFKLPKGLVRTAVDDLSIDFRVGQVTGLLGHNGAGKSTTM